MYISGLVHTAFGRLQYLSSSGTALSRTAATASTTSWTRSLRFITASTDDDDDKHYAVDNVRSLADTSEAPGAKETRFFAKQPCFVARARARVRNSVAKEIPPFDTTKAREKGRKYKTAVTAKLPGQC